MRKIIKKTGMALIILVLMMQFCSISSRAESKDQQKETMVTTPSGIAYEDLQQEIEQFIKEREKGCASVSVKVFENDRDICSVQYGYSDIANKRPADENTVYEWGSISKLFVWISVMQLYEEGEIDLEADIRDYLPENFLTKLSSDTPITMLHLMNHNAGWQEVTYDIEVKNEDEIISLEEALKMSEPPQIYEPGSVCAYSNWGASLAAFIVERISGESYVDYVHNHILQPLGMAHTSVGADFSDNSWVREQRTLLNCYIITQDYYEDYGNAISYILLYPAGSATGTLEDLTTFAKALAQIDEPCPLFKNQETMDLMKSSSLNFGDSDIPRVCHGFWTLQYAKDIIGHSGNTNGCSSVLMFDPETGLGVVILTNEVGETAFNYGMLSLLYGDYSDSERIVNTVFSPSDDLVGIYTSSRTFEKGFSAIYKYMGSLMPLSATDDVNQYKISIGQGILTKVADHQYILDNENGWRYLMYETENADGQRVFQMMSTDVVKEETVPFILKIVTLAMFVIVVLMSIIILIIKFIIGVIRAVKKKKKEDALVVIKNITLIANVIVGVLFYRLILLPLDGGSVNKVPVMMQCMLLAAISLTGIIDIGVLIKICKQKVLVRKDRLKYAVTTVGSVYVSIFIWYWQLFDFWSC